MGDFNLPDWECHTAAANTSRIFLKHLDDNFLVYVLRLSVCLQWQMPPNSAVDGHNIRSWSRGEGTEQLI